MSNTRSFTYSTQSGTGAPLSKTVNVSAASETVINEAIPDNATTVVVLSIAPADLKSFYIVCDQAVRVVATVGDETVAFDLLANDPLVWHEGSQMDNPFLTTQDELVTGGDTWVGATGVTPPTGWTANSTGTPTFATDGDVLTITTDAASTQGMKLSAAITTVVGRRYVVKVKGVAGTAPGTVEIGTTERDYDYTELAVSAGGDFSYAFTATATDLHLALVTQGLAGSETMIIDDISVVEALTIPSLSVTNASGSAATLDVIVQQDPTP